MIWIPESNKKLRPKTLYDIRGAVHSVRVIVRVLNREGKLAGFAFARLVTTQNDPSYNHWFIEGYTGQWEISHWSYIFDPETKQIVVE